MIDVGRLRSADTLPPAWDRPPDVRFADVDGYPLAFLEAGAGAPIVLVHGSMSDYRAWAAQIPALAKTYRVFAPSLRHCYPERWDGAGGDFSVGGHARDLAAFLAGAAPGRAHVVGHSRGGAVALRLALTHPQLVRTLVLADPGGLEGLLPDTAEGRELAAESARMFARLAADLATGSREAAARGFVDALSGPGTWARRTPEQRQMLLDNIVAGPACAERPAFTSRDLAPLAMPILPVTGAGSPKRYALMLAALRACCARVAALVTIPDAAHAMNRDNPDAFNAAVLRFLATAGG